MTPAPLIGVNCDVFTDPTGRIHGVRPACWEAVVRAGGMPVLMPPLADPPLIGKLLDRLDALVLTGGDDIPPARLGLTSAPESVEPIPPERDRTDFTLIDEIRRRRLPTLAICLGCQELNVALGGSIWLDLDQEGPPARLTHRGPRQARKVFHPIAVESAGILDRLWQGRRELEVNSAHHQAIRELGAGLRVLARAPDGIIEAITLEEHPFLLGVQWHPETMPDDHRQRILFEALVEAAVKWKQRPLED